MKQSQRLLAKKNNDGKGFADFILSERYPKELAEYEEPISTRTGLKKTYL